MAAPLVISAAPAVCDHMGQASSPTRLSTRVTLDGQAVVLAGAQYTVAGCPLTTPNGSPVPCATLSFAVGATRVSVEGSPPLLLDARATAIGPLPVQGGGRVLSSPPRVTGS